MSATVTRKNFKDKFTAKIFSDWVFFVAIVDAYIESLKSLYTAVHYLDRPHSSGIRTKLYGPNDTNFELFDRNR